MVYLSLIARNGEVPGKSGLNWGFSKGNVCNNDAYIAIRVPDIKNNLGFFPPLSDDNTFTAVWDDGIVMNCSFEGCQSNPINGSYYPKQISTFDDKSEMGDYLRDRLNVHGRKITAEDLVTYGRDNILITKVGDTYRLDFSV